MHICIGKLTIIGADNGFDPRTSAEILLIRPLGTNFSGILVEIYAFSLKKMHWKMAAILPWPRCVKMWFREWRWLYISSNFTEFIHAVDQKISNGLGNGFVLKRRKVIYPHLWCSITMLGHRELMMLLGKEIFAVHVIHPRKWKPYHMMFFFFFFAKNKVASDQCIIFMLIQFTTMLVW